MKVLTEDAKLVCLHNGGVNLNPRQSWVTIANRRVLVATDPVGCSIDAGCINKMTPNVPCTLTMDVSEGYSTFVRVDGNALCLDTVTGTTNGQIGKFPYSVRTPGQTFISASA